VNTNEDAIILITAVSASLGLPPSSNNLQPVNMVSHHRHRLFSAVIYENTPHSADMLKRILIDARSICNKLPEPHYLHLYTENSGILLITESRNNKVSDQLVDIEGRCAILHCDIICTTGGGVCVFIAKNMNVFEVCVIDSVLSLELCCFDLFCHNNNTMLLSLFIVTHDL
jgi:hypothetical protein